MAKHRKTRQEKMIADQRHVLYHLESPSIDKPAKSETKPSASYKLDMPLPSKTVTASYTYVTADLRKTAIVTAAIIVAQIFLFIILNNM
jgi:hypothetical protein